MYLTVFRNRKRPDMDIAAYAADAERMERRAAAAAGFISIKTFHAEDGEVVTISEWESEAAAKAWGRDPDHAQVQARGKAEYYDSYTLYSVDDARVKHYARATV